MSVARLTAMIKELGLENSVFKVNEQIFGIKKGSATVLTTATDKAVVVMSKLFESVPPKNSEAFFRKLLELNLQLGGAYFVVDKKGAVALQMARPVDGLDTREFAYMLGWVAEAADTWDDKLKAEFYA
jgi:hypothetical protein